MKRIDRIMSSALGHEVNKKTETSDESELEDISAAKSPVLVPAQDDLNPSESTLEDVSASKSPVLVPKELAKDDFKPSDNEFQDGISLCFPVTPAAVIIHNGINGTYVESPAALDVESPAAPPYSPLTPYVIARKALAEANEYATPSSLPSLPSPMEDFEDIQMIDNGTDTNPSPIPPMSPSTLELFETLNQDLSAVEHEDVDKSKRCRSDGISYNDCDQDEDFDGDTDSDYVPDSGEETEVSRSSVKKKSKKALYVPVSDSSEEETAEQCLIQTHSAMVHDNPSRADRTPEVRQNKSPVIITNSIFNDETVDEIISVCEGTNIEADTVRLVSRNDGAPETLNPETDTVTPVLESNDAPGTISRPKRGRKRKHAEHSIAEKKSRKYMNLPYYVNNKLVGPKIFHDYSCDCDRKCFSLISKEKREQEFQNFITLGSYEAQLLYILNNVKESEKVRAYITLTKTKSGKKKPRQYRRNYYICKTIVCKDMFLKTFQISSKKVDVALAKKRSNDTYKDKRGQKQGGWNKTSEEDIEFARNVINSLPKYESHYRRERNSGTQYLKLGMTIQKIYEIYIEEFQEVFGNEKKYLSFSKLKRIFYMYFNLRCKSLKKDTCKKCDLLDLQIKKCYDPEERELLIQQRDDHQKRAEDLRNEMSQDLARAKTDPSFECVTYDLEKTLPLPRIPTNIVFYKRQLWVYNAGIHVGSTDQGWCNVWVEGEAGRGAQEVGSCLINFIKSNLKDGVEDLVLWSDCCGGQNRNIKIVLMLKCILNSHPTLKTITFKYLETGHSFLPNDTDFSKIECALKHHERIYTVEEYMKIMKISKKKNPLQVTRMKTQDFLSTTKMEKKIVNRKICTNKRKVNWLKTKQIVLKKENQYKITMRSESGDIQTLDLSKRQKGVFIKFSEEDFEVLWPQGKPIPQAKLDDLRSMYGLIPEDCHGFYNNLKGNSTIDEDVDGYGPTLDFDLEDDETV